MCCRCCEALAIDNVDAIGEDLDAPLALRKLLKKSSRCGCAAAFATAANCANRVCFGLSLDICISHRYYIIQ